MKARLWQSLFLLIALITTEMIVAEDTKKDVRDLKERNIMSVLYQQTAAERLAGSLQTFQSAKQALDNALADPAWSALPGQNIQGKKQRRKQRSRQRRRQKRRQRRRQRRRHRL